MTPDTAFWQAMTGLLATNLIIIDRPRGSSHPRYPKVIYPLDYGYLENTTASDGGGIDVWLGSLNSAGNKKNSKTLTGILCTFDKLKFDVEIKILLGCTSSDVQTIIDFNTDVQYLFISNPEETHEDHS